MQDLLAIMISSMIYLIGVTFMIWWVVSVLRWLGVGI